MCGCHYAAPRECDCRRRTFSSETRGVLPAGGDLEQREARHARCLAVARNLNKAEARRRRQVRAGLDAHLGGRWPREHTPAAVRAAEHRERVAPERLRRRSVKRLPRGHPLIVGERRARNPALALGFSRLVTGRSQPAILPRSGHDPSEPLSPPGWTAPDAWRPHADAGAADGEPRHHRPALAHRRGPPTHPGRPDGATNGMLTREGLPPCPSPSPQRRFPALAAPARGQHDAI